MKDTIKMGLGAVVMTLLSLFYVYLVGFSNQITEPVTVTVFAVAVVAVAVAAASATASAAAIVTVFVVAAVVVAAVATVGAASATVAVVVASAAAIVVAYNKEKKDISFLTLSLLLLVFALPLVPGTFYLSKYHNYFNQIPRDQRIAGILEVMPQKDGIEVKLSSEDALERQYLCAVLSFHFGSPAKESKSAEIKRYPWGEKEIFCQEGEKIWYKVKLSFEDALTTAPVLWAFFDHAYEDFEVKLPITTTP